jgi:hypothetical protein
MAGPDTGSGSGLRAGSPAGGLAGDSLKPDERAELERLRAEMAKTRRQQADGGRRRFRFRWRGPLATVLIFVGCVLAPLSVVGVWTANQVSDSGRYVANVAPLIRDTAIQRTLTDKISSQITTQLDTKGLVNQAAAALSKQGATRAGDLLSNVSGPVASGVNNFIHDQIGTVVASRQAASLWDQANRTVHAQMVKVLSGQDKSAITVTDGQATLNLGPIIDEVKKNLAAKGLTIVTKIPPVNTAYPLFPAKYLQQGQNAYQLLNTLKVVLPILTLVFLGLGVYVAKRHRRALIGAGLGLAASMFVLGAALVIFRGIYLDSVPTKTLPADAAAALYDTLVRFIKTGLRMVLVVGLLVAAGAFFTGPSVTAVKTRAAFTKGLDWIRGRGEKAGLTTGPVGRWTYTHRAALRIGALALATVIFIFWSQPTAIVAIAIAIVLLITLALIQLIGRPPPAKPASHHA